MIVALPILFGALSIAFLLLLWWQVRSYTAQNPEWTREMDSTSRQDRRRIERAVRRGERLDRPRDARLAIGMVEQLRRVDRLLRGMTSALVTLGAFVATLGLLAALIQMALLGVALLAVALIANVHTNRWLRLTRQAEQVNREQAGLEPEPVGK